MHLDQVTHSQMTINHNTLTTGYQMNNSVSLLLVQLSYLGH